MISRIITALRHTAVDQEATGTFADGAFPLTSADQLAFDRQNSLRESYGRDHLSARKVEPFVASFA
ncbi:hypothetical protein EPK99_18560 [Neorhizobium lilium]|uniref:Uncharacterized protein n=1 Tax=Neorhizobium lilium TaxID=2503024 RepID=A0A3S3SVE5_9HYPH|nr:hypothetical protein [Neorhizobium lilium]RWX75694.1 hypothetical protein EPK99_18560 [Neorhizobium lilium]